MSKIVFISGGRQGPPGVGDTAAGIVMPRTAGVGVKLDFATPTFGWHDLLGTISAEEGGANKPTFAVYRGGIKQWQFAVNNQVYTEFHIPHDYVPNTALFIHNHWSHNSAAAQTATTSMKSSIAYMRPCQKTGLVAFTGKGLMPCVSSSTPS